MYESEPSSDSVGRSAVTQCTGNSDAAERAKTVTRQLRDGEVSKPELRRVQTDSHVDHFRSESVPPRVRLRKCMAGSSQHAGIVKENSLRWSSTGEVATTSESLLAPSVKNV